MLLGIPVACWVRVKPLLEAEIAESEAQLEGEGLRGSLKEKIFKKI